MRQNFAAALSFTLVLIAGVANANTLPSAAGTGPTAAGRIGTMPDDATEMRKAQHALENAENDLLHVAHEFGGHRIKASQAIAAALQEVKQAQQQPTNK